MSLRVHCGVFTDEARFVAAARACSDAGLQIVDAYSPYPIHGLDEIVGIPRSRLPWVTLTGGVLGLFLGFWLQYWASAQDWPINVGGKPWNSFPAFMPVAFELTILGAGVATVFTLLGRSGLIFGRSPQRPIDGVTDDRFALAVRRRAEALVWSDVAAFLTARGAEKTWEQPS